MSSALNKTRSVTASRYLFDFLLNLGMAAAMTCIVCGGFHVAPQIQYNIVLLLVVPAVYLAVMFAAGRTRTMALVGGAVVALATVVAVVVVANLAGVSDVMADTEGNPCIFVAIAACATVLVHLLSRTFTGSVFLFVIGAVVAAVIQFLYLWNYVVLTIVFLACSVATVVFKYYQKAYAAADAKDKPRYGAAFAAGVVTSVIVVALGAGLFVCIDSLFHPQALELKPFKEYFAYEQVDVMGIANSTSVDNKDKTSSNTNKDTTTQNQQQDNKDNKGTDNQSNQGAPTEGSMVSYTQEALEDTFDVIRYGLEWWQQTLLVLLLVLLVVVPIVVKKLLRRRWHAKVLAKSPEEQVVDFYLFFLDRFDKIGLGKPGSATALAFAANNDASIRAFEENAGGVTLAELSEEYTRCAYGGQKAGEGMAERFERFYQSFYKSCRKHVGRFRYLFKFFRV